MATKVTSSSDLAISADIVARRGDTFKRWIQFKKNGMEENLDNLEFRMQVRASTALMLEFSSANASPLPTIKLETAGGGVLVLSASAEKMQSIAPGVYKYDLQQKSAGGEVITRLQGSFTVTSDITILP